MTKQELKERISSWFETDLFQMKDLKDKRVQIQIQPDTIVPFADFLVNKMGLRFIIASAMHLKEGIVILYHFSDDSSGIILNVRVVLAHTNPKIESLTKLFTAANWIEREMHEILGIDFLNHPNLEKLISEGNWAEGVYPYRKDYKD